MSVITGPRQELAACPSKMVLSSISLSVIVAEALALRPALSVTRSTTW